MKRLEVLDLFELAENFSNARPKLYADKGQVFDIYVTLIGLETGLKKFSAEQTAFPLTRESASEVVRVIGALLMEEFFEGGSRDKFKDGLDINAPMSMWQLYTVRAKLEEFRHVLAVECRKSETYFIERVVGFDLPTLLHSADENIHHAIRPLVPKEALRVCPELQAGLQSFLSMRRIEARRKNAKAFRLRYSQSLAKRRQRLSQAMVRSTIQRFGKTTNPLT